MSAEDLTPSQTIQLEGFLAGARETNSPVGGVGVIGRPPVPLSGAGNAVIANAVPRIGAAVTATPVDSLFELFVVGEDVGALDAPWRGVDGFFLAGDFGERVCAGVAGIYMCMACVQWSNETLPAATTLTIQFEKAPYGDATTYVPLGPAGQSVVGVGTQTFQTIAPIYLDAGEAVRLVISSSADGAITNVASSIIIKHIR